MTSINKPTRPLPRLVQYYHPKKGGWYYATLLQQGRKWAKIQHCYSRSVRIPVANIKEVSQ